MIKDKDEDIHRVMAGRAPQELLSSWSWSASPSQHVDVFTKPCTWGILMEASSHRHN